MRSSLARHVPGSDARTPDERIRDLERAAWARDRTQVIRKSDRDRMPRWVSMLLERLAEEKFE